jgi:predicted choloylglycine hydrolase
MRGLLPSYDEAREASGGGDLEAPCLALRCPSAYVTGCSQLVWIAEEPVVIRNYDHAPALCEGVPPNGAWNGRRFMAATDCLCGGLDGVNHAGLAASLTLGGRQVVGEGFGIPPIVR